MVLGAINSSDTMFPVGPELFESLFEDSDIVDGEERILQDQIQQWIEDKKDELREDGMVFEDDLEYDEFPQEGEVVAEQPPSQGKAEVDELLATVGAKLPLGPETTEVEEVPERSLAEGTINFKEAFFAAIENEAQKLDPWNTSPPSLLDPNKEYTEQEREDDLEHQAERHEASIARQTPTFDQPQERYAHMNIGNHPAKLSPYGYPGPKRNRSRTIGNRSGGNKNGFRGGLGPNISRHKGRNPTLQAYAEGLEAFEVPAAFSHQEAAGMFNMLKADGVFSACKIFYSPFQCLTY